ncbi:glycosyltransferase [Sphingorhabdus sp. Alg231-15]|uniref:glycosyltransferase n=1 Tax=Sphingorhabdus sp. Alg231-15 TaxID=1922222 RepID=UPI000D552BC8
MISLTAGLTGLSWLIAAPFLLLFGIFIMEVAAGIFRTGKDMGDLTSSREKPLKIAILIPAHNEASIISRTISALISDVPAETKILVVADNCTDDTPSIARAAGAAVVERNNSELLGKGYALAFGRDALAMDPPDSVIVLDADCTLGKGSAVKLAHAANRLSVPVQATNLIHSASIASPVVQISNFAMLMKNLIRQRGMTRLGGAALLTGTGMAFPWSIFADARLSSGDLAEDLALGINVTKQGNTPVFLESAGVSSGAAAEEDTLVQRTRWEHGFLTTARVQALPLVISGLRTWSRPQVLLGLHLLVPPLALLFASGFTLVITTGLLTLLGASPLPFLILSITLTTAATATIAVWLLEGRRTLSASALIRIPFYILWKIPVYLKLFGGSETRWIRTRRSGEKNSSGSVDE